jgi:PKD repeat protein
MVRIGLLCTLILMLVVSCGCGGTQQTQDVPSDAVISQRMRLLSGTLEQEMQRLGKDLSSAVSEAPQGDVNSVFDLAGQPQYAGTPQVLTGIRLTWTEQLVGDYDQNSEVGAPDIQPIAEYWEGTVQYDDPNEHGGNKRWPSGDPVSDGAQNWRKSRIDGDANTEISISDITTIAEHFGECLMGYRVYRQAPGEASFSLLLNPEDNALPLTVSRLNSEHTDSSPVRYTFTDATATMNGTYHYRIAPYDTSTSTEGTVSVEIAVNTNDTSLNAVLNGNPKIGRSPLTVNFDASASNAAAGITQYEWDWDGDGTYDDTTPGATNQHVYTSIGTYQAGLRITDTNANTDTAALQIQVVSNIPPEASYTANPTGGSAPLNVAFNASASSDADGSIAQYEWDFEGDLSYDPPSNSPLANHQFTTDGSYTVTLRVTDNEGATDTYASQIIVATTNNPPVADLIANPAAGSPPLHVVFWATNSTDSDGTIVSCEYDFDSDGTYDATGTLDEPVDHDYLDYGTYHATLRVTDNKGASDTDTVTITVADGPIPPVADLQLSEHEGTPPLEITLDASGSTASNGPIVKYEWDWEGDGKYDKTTTSPVATHSYSKAGNFVATVRITDSATPTPQTATASDTLMLHGWAIVTVDKDGDNGKDCSFAIIDGHPAVAYYKFTKGLYYNRAVDEYGGTWGTVQKLDGTVEDFETGHYASLQEVSGMPAVVYCDQTPGYVAMNYVRATDATGSTWGSPQTLVSGATSNSSMQITNGKPLVAYRNNVAHQLCVIRASDPLGISWGAPVNVQTTDGQERALQLEIINGNPTIAFTGASRRLSLIRATDTSGTTWPGSATVVDSTDNCQALWLSVINGNPALAYIWQHEQGMGEITQHVYYIRSNDSNGASWGSRVDMGATATTLAFSSVGLASFNNVPVFGLMSNINQNVGYYTGQDANGTTFGEFEAVQNSLAQFSKNAVVTVVAGKLVLIYYNNANYHLTYAVYL